MTLANTVSNMQPTAKQPTFPFGEPVLNVKQEDRSPKSVFFLGVYPSAIHARWKDSNDDELVKALGVASEPQIFWDGEEKIEEAKRIIREINSRLNPEAGTLELAKGSNGPSGKSLKKNYLEPLELERNKVWLSDLVPHSCVNERQCIKLRMYYKPLAIKGVVPQENWPVLPKPLVSEHRLNDLRNELLMSEARVIVTLGDDPLKSFVSKISPGIETKVSKYGDSEEKYGKLHDFVFNGTCMKLLPLVHPRQAGGISRHRGKWKEIHKDWANRKAEQIRSEIDEFLSEDNQH